MKKVVLVTGGSRGLGRAVSERLSKNNWIVYAGLRSLKSSSRLLDEWLKNYKNISPIKLDVTEEQDVKEAVNRIIKEEGRIDILINIAGYSIAGVTTKFDPQDFTKILDTNVVGAFRLIKAVVPQMKKQRDGKIINITSLNGYVSLPNFSLYSSSKFALEALGRGLRHELMADNISVTNIAPGAILAESSEEIKKMPHKPAREKFFALRLIMPISTRGKVVSKIEKIMHMSSPPAQVLIGADTKITTFLQRFLPHSVWDKLVRFIWTKR